MFRDAGHTVWVGDSWGVHLGVFARGLKQLRYPPPRQNHQGFVQALEQHLLRHPTQVLLPTCEEVFWVAKAKERLQELTQVFCPDLPMLHRVHHKGHFVQLAQSLGLAVPESRLLTNRQDVQSLNPKEWVFKPAYSRFGVQTLVTPGVTQTAAVRPTPQQPWLAQRFVAGQELCAYAVALQGCLVALAVYPSRYKAGKATVHYQSQTHQGIQGWVETFVKATGWHGQVAFDFIQDPQGAVWALECNPRLTGGIHLLAQPALAAVFWGQTATQLLQPVRKPQMLAAAMLLQGGVWAAGGWRAFAQAQDVLWRWNDPGPALAQPWLLLALAYRAKQHQCTLLEATTADIEWNGEM